MAQILAEVSEFMRAGQAPGLGTAHAAGLGAAPAGAPAAVPAAPAAPPPPTDLSGPDTIYPFQFGNPFTQQIQLCCTRKFKRFWPILGPNCNTVPWFFVLGFRLDAVKISKLGALAL